MIKSDVVNGMETNEVGPAVGDAPVGDEVVEPLMGDAAGEQDSGPGLGTGAGGSGSDVGDDWHGFEDGISRRRRDDGRRVGGHGQRGRGEEGRPDRDADGDGQELRGRGHWARDFDGERRGRPGSDQRRRGSRGLSGRGGAEQPRGRRVRRLPGVE